MFELLSTKGFKNHVKEARKILEGNWTGRYTKPAPTLYPHQWNWDSGFIAIGYAHYNEDRAMQEIKTLFDHQWENGMLPQIVFDTEALGHYFPEPDFWQVPGRRPTSGITMPPLHAIACLHIYQHAKGRHKVKDFLKIMFPKLMAAHRYLYRFRDPHKTGLVYIRHPWESGLDNSPNWDKALCHIDIDKSRLPSYTRKDLQHGVPAEQRPSDDDYDRYVYLADLFRRLHYDEQKIYGECPFLINDVLFNSILCRANRDLLEIARLIGEDVQEVKAWTDHTSKGISELMWSSEHGRFDPIDLVTSKHIPSATAAGFMPLFAVAATSEQASKLYERLNSLSFCALHQGSCFTIPNYDMSREDFDSKNYWRGPVWININWMLSQGLKSYGYREKSDAIKKDLIQLPIRFGFHEYYDSITGKGYGSNAFSWSAALFIDLVYEYYDHDRRPLFRTGRNSIITLKNRRILNQGHPSSPVPTGNIASVLMAAIGNLKKNFYDMSRGVVDYKAMKTSNEYAAYVELTAHLQTFDLKSLATREETLAFWINLYNTIVVQGIVELRLASSVREVNHFFTRISYRIGGHTFSPDDIEHGILRSNAPPPYHIFPLFRRQDPRRQYSLDKTDPRIHFALVCGSRSCAPIRFYEADIIDEQLDVATRSFVNSSEVVILPEKNKILLSQIFKWYDKDFGKGKDLFAFLLCYLDPDDKAEYLAEHGNTIQVDYLFYDWNLNH